MTDIALYSQFLLIDTSLWKWYRNFSLSLVWRPFCCWLLFYLTVCIIIYNKQGRCQRGFGFFYGKHLDSQKSRKGKTPKFILNCYTKTRYVTLLSNLLLSSSYLLMTLVVLMSSIFLYHQSTAIYDLQRRRKHKILSDKIVPVLQYHTLSKTIYYNNYCTLHIELRTYPVSGTKIIN